MKKFSGVISESSHFFNSLYASTLYLNSLLFNLVSSVSGISPKSSGLAFVGSNSLAGNASGWFANASALYGFGLFSTGCSGGYSVGNGYSGFGCCAGFIGYSSI